MSKASWEKGLWEQTMWVLGVGAMCLVSLALVSGCSVPRDGESGGAGQQEEAETAAADPAAGTTKELPLDSVELPEGFSISLFADDVPNARSLTLGAEGTVFVGTRTDGRVFAVTDGDRDGVADTVHTLAEGLDMPNGVAYRDGDLYLAEVGTLWRYPDIEEHLADPPEPELIHEDLPDIRHHGWKFIAFGPDGWLYVPVGAPCNICESKNEIFASILRMKPDGSGREVYAHGVRNTVGFDWHPATDVLWFTDNGRDWMGDDQPPDELNRAPKKGLHFGYPYCHGGDIPDPDFGAGRECSEFEPPAQRLGPHVAALGLRFYTGDQFPAEYKNQIFFAEHGSWNRTEPIGYRVMLVRLEGTEAVSYEPFAEGWLQGDEVWGRPVDVQVMPDGSMLVSDDRAGVIYRITYDGG